MHPTQANKQAERDQVVNIGLWEASKWAIYAGIPAVLASMWANHKYEFYRTRFGTSAKVATPLMAALAAFGYKFEKSAYSLANDGKVAPEVIRESKLPKHQQWMNWCYDHPFSMILFTGTPLAGTILYQQLQHPHLKLQQRIMHTRIFAQAGILSILLLTMGFRTYMEKRGGRFVSEDDEDYDDEE